MSFYNISRSARKAQEEWPATAGAPKSQSKQKDGGKRRSHGSNGNGERKKEPQKAQCGFSRREPMTREKALELVTSEGDDERAFKWRVAGWYGLVETTVEYDDWLDVVRRIAADFAIVPKGAVKEFLKRRPSGIFDEVLESAILSEAAKRLATETDERWAKVNLTLAYRVVEFFGGNDPRVKRFFQKLADGGMSLPPRKICERVDIRWQESTTTFNPAFLANGRKGPSAKRKAKVQERAERDRQLREKMAGGSRGGEKNAITNPKTLKKRQKAGAKAAAKRRKK